MTKKEMFEAMRWSAAEKAEFEAKFPRLYADVELGSTWSMDHVSCGRGWRTLIERVFEIANSTLTFACFKSKRSGEAYASIWVMTAKRRCWSKP